VQTAKEGKHIPVEKMEEAASNVKQAVEQKKERVTKKAKKVAAKSSKPTSKKEVVIEGAKKIKTTAVKATKQQKNVVVEGAKEITTNAVTTAKAQKSMVIEGAKEVAGTAKTAIKDAAPKIIEAPTKAAAVVKKEAEKKVTALKSSTVDHSAWDQLLRKYVSGTGKVNYKGLKANKGALEAYLKTLDAKPIQNSWSRSQKMAYWINAYNAFTIKLIVDNYPLTSITKLHGGKPWDHSWIQLGGKTYTLNDIEHKILRPQFKDARIHFAVNCAASSCPPVLNRAWTAANLKSNLEKQAKLFINNAAFNSIASDKIAVSKIFDWYKEDFGDLISYLNKYSTTKIKSGTALEYKEYDWALNE